MNYKLKILASILLIVPFLLNSCKEEDLDVKFDPEGKHIRHLEFAGPLAKIDIEMLKWLDALVDNDNDTVYADRDDLVHIKFMHKETFNWDKLIELQNISNQIFPLTIPSSPFSGELQIPIGLAKNADARFKWMTYSKGEIEIRMEVPSGSTGYIDFEIPEMTETKIDGTKAKIQFPRFNLSQGTYSQKLDIKNGEITFSDAILPGDTQRSYNLINIKSSAGNLNTNVNFIFTLRNLEIDEAYGYFGEVEDLKKDRDFKFGLFEDLQILNQFHFGNIILTTEVENQIGVPFLTSFDNIKFYKDDKDLDKALTKYGDDIYINIAKASGYVEHGVSPKPEKSELIIDDDNSNIGDIGNLFPNKMRFDMTTKSNHNYSNNDNYIGKERDLEVNLSLDFPLWFRAALYERKDTIDFDMSEWDEWSEHLEYFDLICNVRNRLPFDVKIDIYVLDDNDKRLYTDKGDSIYIIKGGIFSPTGIPNEGDYIKDDENAKFVEYTAHITRDHFLEMKGKNVKKMVFNTKSSTYQHQNERLIKVYAKSGMNIHVSFDAKLGPQL